MVHVVKQMTKDFKNKKNVVIADNAYESMEIMEWGSRDDVQIVFVMTCGGGVCHLEYFRTKKTDMYNNFKTKQKPGAMMVTHSDTCTFTMIRYSSVMRVVDNCLDYEDMTPRIIRRFYKERKGAERWKGYAKVSTSN